LLRRYLFLHHIPMLGDPAVGDTEDIDSHHGLGDPSKIASVDENVVSFRRHETRLIFEVSREIPQEYLDRSDTIGNLRIATESRARNSGLP